MTIPEQQRSPYDLRLGQSKPLKRQVNVAPAHSPHQHQGDRGGEPDDDVYLTSAQVKKRYGGASSMWLWRRLKNDPRFPRPLIVAKRRLWKLSALVTWERRQAAASA
jgi:hypothetical protein